MASVRKESLQAPLRLRASLALALLGGLLAAPARAAGADVSALSAHLSSFEVLPPSVWRPDLARPEVQEALSARHPGYLRFLAEHPGPWRAEWNEAGGTPHRIYGGSLPLALPDGRPPGSPEELEAAARALMARHRDLLGVGPEELALELVKDLEAFQVVRFRQTRRGMPVLGARVELRVAPGGRVVLLGADVIPERLLGAPEEAPRIAAAAAEGRAGAHASRRGRPFRPERTRLCVAPLYLGRDLVPRLAYQVRTRGEGEAGKWVYLVAAGDGPGGAAGEVLGGWDEAARGTVAGTARGKATPGLSPDASWNPAEFAPLKNLTVTAGARSAVTGEDGSFEITYPGSGSVTVSASLRGPYCRVDNVAGVELTFSRGGVASGTTNLAVDFNVSPVEFATSQVNAFLQVNRAHDFVKSLDPSFTAIDRPILAQVNVNDSCNAYFIPEGDGVLSFFRANPCANTAYSTVIHHEYGHFVVWKAFGSAQPMPAYNEGVADSFAALLTDQPVIGHQFNGQQAGPPIRDLSRQVLRYPDDLLLEYHHAGLIVGGAFWGLRQSLGAALGPEAGLERARRLFLAPPMISPGLTLDLLQLDDGDGILANGTPHFEQIASAFGRHGMPPPGHLRIAHERLGDSPSAGPFEVRAAIGSDFSFVSVLSAALRYSVDGGFQFASLPLAALGGGLYLRGGGGHPHLPRCLRRAGDRLDARHHRQREPREPR
jgi:hypothetical protein